MSWVGSLIYWSVITLLSFYFTATMLGAFFLKGAWIESGDAFNAAPIWVKIISLIAAAVIGVYAVRHERRGRIQ
ncbi:hypothetical protein ACR52_24115 [Pseudomonas fildesensis]|uniref:Uncharacterized protein n=1 Tax=Pseudomonas fildesensis TaxID=1674920 RepID=A0A0J8FXK3_9PSED|nr:hypothetical protein ACR52_24115 [Pseudomonas fildesensis]